LVSYPASLALGMEVSDPLAGFRAISRKHWDKLGLQSNGFEIETEMNIKALRLGFAITQVSIPNLKRCGGLQASKFIKSPKMWFKIFKMILQYQQEKDLLGNREPK
jgi:hypothetical protein